MRNRIRLPKQYNNRRKITLKSYKMNFGTTSANYLRVKFRLWWSKAPITLRQEKYSKWPPQVLCVWIARNKTEPAARPMVSYGSELVFSGITHRHKNSNPQPSASLPVHETSFHVRVSLLIALACRIASRYGGGRGTLPPAEPLRVPRAPLRHIISFLSAHWSSMMRLSTR